MAHIPHPIGRRPTGSRRLAILAITLFALLVVLRAVPSFYVDYLWFREVGYLPVFLTTLWSQTWAQVLFGAIFLACFLPSVLWAIRGVPQNFAVLHELRTVVPGVERIRPALRAIAVAAGLVLALLVGRWGSYQWLSFLRFRHAETFGLADPVFRHDLGFYVFTLPFVQALAGFVTVTLAATFAATAVVYFFQAQLWARPGFLAVTAMARRHLMLLLAFGLLLFAGHDLLGRYDLLYSARGIVAGAGYADLHGALPGLVVAAAITVAAALVVGVEAFRRTFHLTGISLGVVVLAHAGLVMLWPALLQRLVVTPNEINRERPYLEREIASTRRAFGLDHVEEGRFPASQNLTAARVAANSTTIDNVRLWETEPLKTTNGQLQEIRTYYDFVDVDNDRYVLSGELRQVALSTRELNPAALPARIWINEHLTYTHGYGVCVAPVNRISPEGLPEYFVKDIPPVSTVPELEIRRPEIYYGELASEYTFVRSRAREFDYPSGDENVYTRYEGRGGIPLDGFWGRLLFSLRFAEPKILLSTDLEPGSRVLIQRRVRERVARIAPFLLWEPDPYLVIRRDGTLTWMLDGFTATDRIPYSRRIPRLGNYVRNAVKATVDAYHGTVTLWAMDADDPLLRSYAGIFPGLFASADSMPEDLRAHVRYPEGMLAIQAEVYATYHMTDPQVFYNKEDLWRVARRQDGTSVAPYYTVMKLAGVGEREEFILMLPFTPARKENMIAWMSARCDPPNYGRLLVYSFPKQSLVYGPQQIESRINQDTEISKELTLWNQQGSQVIRGNLLVVPVDSSLVYFQPLYLQAQTQAGLPELKRILVASGDRIAMEPTMDAALRRVFGAGAETSPAAAKTVAPDGEAPAGGIAPAGGEAEARLRRAGEIYQRAQQALRRGDLQGYAREMEDLGRLLQPAAR
jgi:hypothetical protein